MNHKHIIHSAAVGLIAGLASMASAQASEGEGDPAASPLGEKDGCGAKDGCGGKKDDKKDKKGEKKDES